MQGYEALQKVFVEAFKQAAVGKGKVRHANDKAFTEQPILSIARMVGVGGTTFQVMKKAQEAASMHQKGDSTAAVAELYGVMVYAATTVIYIQENMADAVTDNDLEAALKEIK